MSKPSRSGRRTTPAVTRAKPTAPSTPSASSRRGTRAGSAGSAGDVAGRSLMPRAAPAPGTGAAPGATGAACMAPGRRGVRRLDLGHGVLGAPARHRPAQRAERDEADRRRQPDGDRAVGEHRDEREVGRHGEGDEDADDAAADGARDRDGVADLAHEVGEHDDRERRRRAEGVEHRPQHRGVERPPGQRAEQARVGRAHVADRVAHGGAEHVGGRVQARRRGAACAAGARPGPARRRWRAWRRRPGSRSARAARRPRRSRARSGRPRRRSRPGRPSTGR